MNRGYANAFSERKRSAESLLAGQSITPPPAASQRRGFACPGRAGCSRPPQKNLFSGRIKPELGHCAGAEGGGHWGSLPRRPQNTRGLSRGGGTPTANRALREPSPAQRFGGHRGAGTPRVTLCKLPTGCSQLGCWTESFQPFFFFFWKKK